MPSKKASAVDPVPDSRGQIALPVAGQEYVLRPSFEAMEAIEDKLGPLLQLAKDASQGALTMRQMGIMAAEMMRAYGKANPDDPLKTDYQGANPDRLARLIYEASIPKVQARFFVILAGALNGGYTETGEATAGTDQTTE